MLNQNINAGSGITNTPDSQNNYKTDMEQGVMNNTVPINSLASQTSGAQFEPQHEVSDEEAQVWGYFSHGNNLFIDKYTNEAKNCIEDMRRSVGEKGIYIDARNKASCMGTVMDVDNFLGFDHRAVNNVESIIIDNFPMQEIEFIVYLDRLLRVENQTNKPFNGTQMVIMGDTPPYFVPMGFNVESHLNENEYNMEGCRADLHVALRNSYRTLWSLAGFIVRT